MSLAAVAFTMISLKREVILPINVEKAELHVSPSGTYTEPFEVKFMLAFMGIKDESPIKEGRYT